MIFKCEEKKYQPLSLHKEKTIFYTLRRGKNSNADYLEKFNTLLDRESKFIGKLHDQAIVDIATERK